MKHKHKHHHHHRHGHKKKKEEAPSIAQVPRDKAHDQHLLETMLEVHQVSATVIEGRVRHYEATHEADDFLTNYIPKFERAYGVKYK